MKILKKVIKNVLAKLGYCLRPIDFHALNPDLFFNQIYIDNNRDKKFFLNIGAGRFRHKYWINLDLHDEYIGSGWTRGDINHDLLSLEPIPLKGESVRCVYTSHTIEHLSDAAVYKLFNEVNRILIKGGTFRVVCPDIDIALSAFLRNDLYFFSQIFGEKMDDVTQGLIRFCATEFQSDALAICSINDSLLENGDILNKLDNLCKNCNLETQRKNPNNHINWFNEQRLKNILEEVGFINIISSRYGQSREGVLRDTRYFDQTLPYMSLYIEAQSP